MEGVTRLVKKKKKKKVSRKAALRCSLQRKENEGSCPSMALIVGQWGRRYELRDELGQGGFGKVKLRLPVQRRSVIWDVRAKSPSPLYPALFFPETIIQLAVRRQLLCMS